MKINHINKVIREGRAYVESEIHWRNNKKLIFFSVPETYGEYLVDEVDDAFIYALIMPALVEGEDI